MFSKTYCPHCAKVKALFADLKTDFELVELDERGESSLLPSWVTSSFVCVLELEMLTLFMRMRVLMLNQPMARKSRRCCWS